MTKSEDILKSLLVGPLNYILSQRRLEKVDQKEISTDDIPRMTRGRKVNFVMVEVKPGFYLSIFKNQAVDLKKMMENKGIILSWTKFDFTYPRSTYTDYLSVVVLHDFHHDVTTQDLVNMWGTKRQDDVRQMLPFIEPKKFAELTLAIGKSFPQSV